MNQILDSKKDCKNYSIYAIYEKQREENARGFVLLLFYLVNIQFLFFSLSSDSQPSTQSIFMGIHQ